MQVSTNILQGERPPQLFTCVGVDMIPEEGDCTESFQAKVTHVGLFSAVNFHMTIETRNSRRAELAEVAVEGSFYFCRRERQHWCVCKHFPLGAQIPLKYIKVTWHILFFFFFFNLTWWPNKRHSMKTVTKRKLGGYTHRWNRLWQNCYKRQIRM